MTNVIFQCAEHRKQNSIGLSCIGVEAKFLTKPQHIKPKLSAWLDTTRVKWEEKRQPKYRFETILNFILLIIINTYWLTNTLQVWIYIYIYYIGLTCHDTATQTVYRWHHSNVTVVLPCLIQVLFAKWNLWLVKFLQCWHCPCATWWPRATPSRTSSTSTSLSPSTGSEAWLHHMHYDIHCQHCKTLVL